ncbi:unnamed protein product [Olea europaea subsp. europaea]|uniref:Unnamed protein product n=1 Tax=Olea europaea subsp. europaea TaxID=158383 RepID=A0A8S0UG06_OLEEU|nr:unnamed protein product [Olea europaea subsp. europaea]
MLKRGITISLFSNIAVVLGWCRTRHRKRRRKGSTVRLGNKKRGFCMASRQVVHWQVVFCPARMLKKIVLQMAANERLVEAYCWSLPFLRPQLFPLC